MDSAKILKNSIRKSLGEIHKQENVHHVIEEGYLSPAIRFSPGVLIGAKSKENFCFYEAGFGISGKEQVRTSEITIITKEYKAIGSGSKYAYLVFNQLNRLLSALDEKISNLELDVVISIALYIIKEVKKIDPECGKSTQISVIDENSYRKIEKKEKSSCYNVMIDRLYNLLDSNIPNIREITKKLLSVGQIG